jgi:pimeloyl-ACP methyl ester carboxylesterase
MPYYLTKDNTKIYYEILCSNSNISREKLILINGLASPISYWLDIPQKLSQYYDVLIYDHRGVGKSDTVEKIYSVDTLENDLNQLIQLINWDKYHLLGISLGGFIALKHAEKDTEKKIQSLTLISTHPGLKYLYYPLHNPFFEFIKWRFLPKEKRIHEIIYFNSGSDLKITNPKLYQRLYESRLKEKVALDKNFWLQTLAGSFFWGINYKKIHHPTLIIHGKKDRVVPWQNAYILSKLLILAKNLEVKIFDDCGHLCLWEKEDVILEEIKKFISNFSNQSEKNFINLNI